MPSVTEGGTTLTPNYLANDWFPVEDNDPTTGELYGLLKTMISDEMAKGATFGGIIWVQGEADARYADTAGQYGELIEKLFSELTLEFGSDWEMVVSMLHQHAPIDREGWAIVRTAQEEFIAAHERVIGLDPADVANSIGVSIGDNFLDALHYSVPVREGIFLSALQELTNAQSAAIIGTDLVDTLHGTPKHDLIAGRSGRDIIRGHGGDDVIAGGLGSDLILGGNGSDVMEGNEGDDRMFGGVGRDRLLGGRGNDQIFGGSSNDWIAGGPGDDKLRGGWGADRFVFGAGDGRDVIFDFQPGRDVLQITGEISAIKQIGSHTRIFMSDPEDVLILRDTDLGDLDGILI